ncbi:heme o synthase [Thioclava sp. DLFJ4-1]|uniref:heme o synthase n=1 Tax=Thioclava sp. DLFJ4-1 TaxID=1915313 RepID=UPI001AEF5512|nr:heme o synthase [Thioclava sp. DLFJ4-1]
MIRLPHMEASRTSGSELARAYLELCKPKVVMVMIFTALVGELLADPLALPIRALILGNLGIAMAAGSAAAINHLIDQRLDARMARTRRRPIPTGLISSGPALVFALALGAAGLILLYTLINPLTAVLTFASLIGYAVIYTGFLKRATSQNIVIGGLAGAAPPLLGWTAVTDRIEALPVLLVMIIFVWTPPHFWPLAIHRIEDYRRAEVPMLPATHGEVHTRWQVLFYTTLMVAVTLVPALIGLTSFIYPAAALTLGGMFLFYSIAMLVSPDPSWPMRTFRFSITYILLLFGALVIDSYLMAALLS